MQQRQLSRGLWFVGLALAILALGGAAPPARAQGERDPALAGTAPLLTTTPTPPPNTPLVFIPGIGGSYLVDNNGAGPELWPGLTLSAADHVRLSLYPSDAPSRIIIATDVIRTIRIGFLTVGQVYAPLLDMLTGQAGYHEYAVANTPARRTTAGCDLSQAASHPTLFVFAYDWRQSNAANAGALADYIGCVRQLWPGRRVNILTHSMGGLVARRYILDHADAPVQALVTVAAPWLGAPKIPYVLETGDFGISYLGLDLFRYLMGSWPGAHELLPSGAYATLNGGPAPFAEAGWDLDGDGQSHETYAYANLITLLNRRYAQQGFTPGTTGEAFHAVGPAARHTQDDWRADTGPVQYYHLFGQQAAWNTIGSVRTETLVHCRPGPAGSRTCTRADVLRPQFTAGDGTVPRLSATRSGAGLDLNAPGAALVAFTAPADGSDAQVEHNGLVQNPVVLARLREILAANQQADGGWKAPRRPADSAPVAAYDLLLAGGQNLVVRDNLGNSTAPGFGGIPGSVPGVTIYTLRTGAQEVRLNATGVYTVTFGVGSGPAALDLTRRNDPVTNGAIRYPDLALPVGAGAILTLTANSMLPLRYDADGDGTYEAVLTPTVNLVGADAGDATPPVINITATTESVTSTLVLVSATDPGSGVQSLYYSIDGSTYRPYTGALRLDPAQVPTLYVFADDTRANRGARTFAVPYVCPIQFSDVDQANPFYGPITCLACQREAVISGYGDGSFRPGNNVTRGQVAKLVANAAGYSAPISATQQTFTDVPPSSPLWAFVERIAAYGYISGYTCGGPGEQCDDHQRSYFRPNANITRGQLAKIIANAAGFGVTPPDPTFTDVPAIHPFYAWVQRIAHAGIISGYTCGGPGEDCDDQRHPYFRPANPATRGQSAKIIAASFFPACAP